MTALFVIGRLVIGLYFIFNGVNHFMRDKILSEYAHSKGVPMPTAAVMATGVLLLLGGLSMLLGLYPVFGVVILLIFFIPVSVIMHNFWAVSDPQAKMIEMVNFLKNMALVGALLMFLMIPRPWPFGVVF